MSKSKAPLLIQWVEYGWARMRAFDYWNPGHLASHYPHKYYRNVSPGSAPTAEVPVSGSDRIFDIRYFDKDTRRKDTGYSPDTALSLNHPIMKNRPKRAPDDPPSQLPVVGAFGKMTSNIPTGTPERMGMRENGLFD